MVHFTELRADESRPETPIHAAYIHFHLPKLAAAEYITWDDQSYKLSEGPRFAEVKPVVEIVQKHDEQLPGEWM